MSQSVRVSGLIRWLILFFFVFMAGCSGMKYSLYEMAMNHERSKAGLELKTIEAGGKTISLLESNRGKNMPTIVLVHGFTANKENWVRFAAYLTDAYHVVAMDLPGHGDSVKDFNLQYDFSDQVVYVNEILTQLNIKKFHMAGNSMGGAIVALYAVAYPEKVQSLFLFDPAGIHRYDCELNRCLAKGENPLIAGCEDDFYDLIDLALEEKPFIPWPITRVMAEKAVANEAINKKIFADLSGEHGYCFESEIQKIITPTLILWGAEDRLIDVKNAAIFHEEIPNSRVMILKGVGHAAMIEVPEKSSKIYIDFISSIQCPTGEIAADAEKGSI
ncbi:MAG: alpha/beta hydrolase [Desulfobacteraceae bacterium]|jgi:abhydrolase domain-containing protein 6|nr:alpha/beta hydrolase [Desulfobacteraceae bacterium]